VPSFKGFPPDAQCRTGGCVRLCWSVGIYRANAKGYHRAIEGIRMTVLAKVLAKALAADEAEANKFEINPVDGEELEKPVKDVYQTPPEIAKKAAAAVR